jgi:hypothetical protein
VWVCNQGKCVVLSTFVMVSTIIMIGKYVNVYGNGWGMGSVFLV